MKKIWIALTMAGALTFASCQSPQEEAIEKIKDLKAYVQENAADFTSEDWEDIAEQFADIKESLNDVEFSQEELQQLGEAEGELTKTLMKEGSKSVGKELKNAMENVESYFKGFTNGMSEDEE